MVSLILLLPLRRAAHQPESDSGPLTLDDELAALDVAARSQSPRATLLARLASPRPPVRERAIELLAAQPLDDDPLTLDALTAAISDSSLLVRWRAAHLLHQLGSDAWSDEAAFAAWQAGLVDQLLAMLTADAATRWSAVEAITGLRLADTAPQLAAKVRDTLVAALRDEHAPVRWAVAEALSEMGDPDMVAALLGSLHHPDPLVRRSIATTLGLMRAQAAVVPLITLLRDTNPSVRQSAAEGLGQIADRLALAPLIVALSDDDVWVRVAAAVALGKLGDGQAAPSLARLAEGDESLVVRRAAIAALAALSHEIVHPTMLHALSDADAMICATAAAHLAHIGLPADRDALRPLLRDQRTLFGRSVGQIASATMSALEM